MLAPTPYSIFLPPPLALLYFLGLHLKLPWTSSQHQPYEWIASHFSLPSGVPCFPMTPVWHNEETVTFPTRGHDGDDV